MPVNRVRVLSIRSAKSISPGRFVGALENPPLPFEISLLLSQDYVKNGGYSLNFFRDLIFC